MTTLNKAIEICRGMEAASHNMKALKNEEVKKIKGISKKKSGQHKHWHRIKKPLQSVGQKALKKKCLFCCQIKAMKKEMCPAWEKSCVACGERNHFKASNKCKLQSVNFLADDYSSDSSESSTETISTVTACEDQVVNSVDSGNQLIFCEMEINNKPVRMQIDCGPTVCILPKCYLGDLPIRPERVRLQMWNKKSLSALSKCKVKVRNPTTNEQYKVDFVIVDNDLTPLLSSVAAQKMNLISVHFDKLKAVNVVTQVNHPYFTQFP